MARSQCRMKSRSSGVAFTHSLWVKNLYPCSSIDGGRSQEQTSQARVAEGRIVIASPRRRTHPLLCRCLGRSVRLALLSLHSPLPRGLLVLHYLGWRGGDLAPSGKEPASHYVAGSEARTEPPRVEWPLPHRHVVSRRTVSMGVARGTGYRSTGYFLSSGWLYFLVVHLADKWQGYVGQVDVRRGACIAARLSFSQSSLALTIPVLLVKISGFAWCPIHPPPEVELTAQRCGYVAKSVSDSALNHGGDHQSRYSGLPRTSAGYCSRGENGRKRLIMSICHQLHLPLELY
jgi:hypothetical protein